MKLTVFGLCLFFLRIRHHKKRFDGAQSIFRVSQSLKNPSDMTNDQKFSPISDHTHQLVLFPLEPRGFFSLINPLIFLSPAQTCLNPLVTLLVCQTCLRSVKLHFFPVLEGSSFIFQIESDIVHSEFSRNPPNAMVAISCNVGRFYPKLGFRNEEALTMPVLFLSFFRTDTEHARSILCISNVIIL